VLWPESSEVRAHASLRSALARAQQIGTGAIQSHPVDLALAPGVAVDLNSARNLAHGLLDRSTRFLPTQPARSVVANAAGAALAAIAADPLRESSHATLVRVHLAEGNRWEALRAFSSCRELLARELHVAPTPALSALVAGLPA